MKLAQAARALGHPTRVKVMRELRKIDDTSGERLSPSELAVILDQPLGDVSYHVRILLHNKAVRGAGRRAVRGATEHFYRLSANGRRLLDDMPDWLLK